jgi:hypothetical protein
VSTPPASTTLARPAIIFSTPVQIAWLDEMQAIDTVWPAMLLGRPAPNAASRAMLYVDS